MSLDNPEEILNLSMAAFLRRFAGKFDPGAPPHTQWAQAASAALKPDTAVLRQGQVTLIERWLNEAGSDQEESWWRRIGITLAVHQMEGQPESDQREYGDDPDRFIKLADFFAHLEDQPGIGDD